MSDIKLKPPLNNVSVFVMPGVVPEKAGIYVFVVDRLGVYVGEYGRDTRYLRDYSRNIRAMNSGQPYRTGTEKSYRRIHVALKSALDNGYPISLILLENVAPKPKRLERERELIRAIGTLNGRQEATSSTEDAELVTRTETRNSSTGNRQDRGFWSGYKIQIVPNSVNTFGARSKRFKRIEMLRKIGFKREISDFIKDCSNIGANRPTKIFFKAAIEGRMVLIFDQFDDDVTQFILRQL
jgi:hypothetical protein